MQQTRFAPKQNQKGGLERVRPFLVLASYYLRIRWTHNRRNANISIVFSIYLSAVWSNMLARLSGIASLVFTGLGVYTTAFAGQHGSHNARLFCWSMAMVCFLYANFRTWADEHRRAISTEPDFFLRVEQVYFEFSEAKNHTVLIFAVSLINRGSPSSTNGWFAVFEMNGISEPMALIHIAGNWIIRRHNQEVTIRSEDQITAKTVEGRVQTGEGKTGRVFFTLPGNRLNQLNSLQFRVRIGFRDFRGHRFESMFIPSPTPIIGVAKYANEVGQIIAEDAPDQSAST